MRKTASVLAFALMVAGIVLLYYLHALLGTHPLAIGVQIAAVLLMIAARVTFGRRSFHAAANPTAGGIVTTGPYGYVRHPIYAAVLYFTWAGALNHPSAASIACAVSVAIGAFACSSRSEC
jgi:protein-S-isoprenylcysteine O-methyltransferase Ste14